MLNRELEDTLSQAFQSASSSRHEFLTVEHLLLALIDNRHAFEVLAACGADFDALVNQLHNFLKETTPQLPENVEASETQPTLVFNECFNALFFMFSRRVKRR